MAKATKKTTVASKPPEPPKPVVPAPPPPPAPPLPPTAPLTPPAVDPDPKIVADLAAKQAELDAEKEKLDAERKALDEAPAVPDAPYTSVATGPTGEQKIDPKVELQLRERQERLDRQKADAEEAAQPKETEDQAARQRVYYPDIAVGPIPKD